VYYVAKIRLNEQGQGEKAGKWKQDEDYGDEHNRHLSGSNADCTASKA